MKIVSPWPVVGLLWVAYLINYVDRQVVFSIYPALRTELHFSDAQLGLIGTVFIWVYSLCMPVTGRIADIFSRNRVVVASLLLWSAATLGTALSNSVALFLFWRGVVGVTESMYMPAALGLIASLHPGLTRSRALAVHITAQYAGIVAGGWYGGWAADHIGWRMGFGALTVVGVVYGGVLWHVLGNVKSQRAVPEGHTKSSPFEVLRSRCYLAMCLAFFALCVMLWVLYAWLPIVVYERFHLSMAESGLIATLYLQASSMAGVLLGGTLADRLVRRTHAARYFVASAGLLLCTPFAYLTLSAHSLLALKIGATGFGLTAGLMMSNHFASAYDVVAERHYGFATGTLNMVGGIAGGVGILGAGLWRASVGIATLTFWAATATAISACILLATAAVYFKADRIRAGLL